jgi:hypothetical protein
MLVYWLASEGLPMLKIYTLAMLIRALDFRGAINCVWKLNSGTSAAVWRPKFSR